MALKKHFIRYLKAVFLPWLTLFVFVSFYFYAVLVYFVLLVLSPFSFRLSQYFFNYSFTLSMSLDQLANASAHGSEDQSVSGRLGYAIHYKKNPNKIYAIICKILNIFFRQDNHCLDAIEYDRLFHEKNL